MCKIVICKLQTVIPSKPLLVAGLRVVNDIHNKGDCLVRIGMHLCNLWLSVVTKEGEDWEGEAVEREKKGKGKQQRGRQRQGQGQEKERQKI